MKNAEIKNAVWKMDKQQVKAFVIYARRAYIIGVLSGLCGGIGIAIIYQLWDWSPVIAFATLAFKLVGIAALFLVGVFVGIFATRGTL